MLTALAITRPRMTSEAPDSIPIASYAQWASGITSVGAGPLDGTAPVISPAAVIVSSVIVHDGPKGNGSMKPCPPPARIAPTG
jgi:hypothetical protein